ncbi:MAG TPA: archaeosortase/exosortase family protein [Acidimicrobiales bacterium]|jgi:exosortase/archaeosortase family protein|nr:archaeosortase/exosortase family protein [Acidimicrobiales bacterium]
MTYPVGVEPTDSGPISPWDRPAVQAVTAAVMALGGALVLLASQPLRTAELKMAGVVMSIVTGKTVVYRPEHIVYFETAASRTVGLEITASCTAIFLVVPFFFLGAIMAFIPRVRILRLLLGLTLGAATVFILNQLRLLMIAWATWHWGITEGFNWSHILAGGVITTIGVLIGLFLFFRFSLAGRRWSPRV